LSGAGSESIERWVIRGRTILYSELQCVTELAQAQPGATRSGLARALCERWQWRTANGQWKIRSALGVLNELARRGLVALPALRSAQFRSNSPRSETAGLNPQEFPKLGGSAGRYRPLRWELVSTATGRQQWRELLNRYHYLGAPQLVGPNLMYLVHGREGELLGALGWHAAVQHLGCRDRLIGWDATQRAHGLERVVNGVRFLILPWVRVPRLASVMLSEGLRQLQADWLQRYGVSLWLAESFVDRQRFSGTSYRAANWQAVGWTRGYRKTQGKFIHHGQIKEVYVYVMEARMRQWVHANSEEPLLTREYLLAQRLSEITEPLTRSTRMKSIQAAWKPKLPPELNLSIEDIECVGRELSEFTGLFRETFQRREPAELCELYLQGLLGNTPRKNVEAMAMDLDGPDAVRSLQRFVTDSRWDEDFMRQQHWKLSAESLSDPLGVWSLDASEFPKKGEASVGVAHQYCGALGKTANCQSGVFICYSSPKGHALLDSRLYLPECWFGKKWKKRREECRIPESVKFQTKPQLAAGLLNDLVKTKLFAGQWVTCDCSFGNNEGFLEDLPPGLLYLGEIACTRKVWIKECAPDPKLETEGCTVERLVQIQGAMNWQNRRIGEGEKGPLVAGFARVRVHLDAARTPESERWLLLRNDANCQIKYALSNAPMDTPMTEMVRVSGARWPIEQCFAEEKSDLGLDHYEHRSWTAWHRHTRLVSLAQLFLLRLRHKFKKNSGIDAFASSGADCANLARSEASH
jgi:SRSO17 transposase